MTIQTFHMVLLTLLVSGCAYHVFALFCALEFFRPKPKSRQSASPMPVSILKPIKGTDPELRENLATFCSQEYPQYEVLLGLFRPRENEAKRVRETLVSGPARHMRLIVSSKQLGTNRKVSNLQGLVEAARHQLLAISDSDMRVNSLYLREITAEYAAEKKIGMVTCLYKISEPGTFGAALESLTIAMDFIPSVLVARRLEGITFGLGASMLVSKKALADIGGFPAIADYLADDYQLGNRLAGKGYVNVLSRTVLENVAGPMSISDYVTHQIRWARTYRASRPKGFAGYGITYIFPLALLLLIARPDALSLSLLGTAVGLRMSLSAVMYTCVIRTRQWLKWLALLPLKDLSGFGIWAWSFLSSTVIWRGRSYKIVKKGKIIEQP